MIIFLKVFCMLTVLAVLVAGTLDAIDRWNRKGPA